MVRKQHGKQTNKQTGQHPSPMIHSITASLLGGGWCSSSRTVLDQWVGVSLLHQQELAIGTATAMSRRCHAWLGDCNMQQEPQKVHFPAGFSVRLVSRLGKRLVADQVDSRMAVLLGWFALRPRIRQIRGGLSRIGRHWRLQDRKDNLEFIRPSLTPLATLEPQLPETPERHYRGIHAIVEQFSFPLLRGAIATV